MKNLKKIAKPALVALCALTFITTGDANATLTVAVVAADAAGSNDNPPPPVEQAANVPQSDAGPSADRPDKPEKSQKRLPGELTQEAIENAPVEAVAELVSSVRTGDRRKTVALMLSLVMLAIRRYSGNFKFLAGDRAGVAILFATSFTGALVTSLLGNAPVDYRMFMAAFEIGLLAMGGFLGVKKLLWPDDKAKPAR